MISAHATCIPFLGRRWRAHCHRCGIDLPGRHADRHDALTAGDEHLALRHERAGVGVQ